MCGRLKALQGAASSAPERRARDEAALDEDRAQQPAALGLLAEGDLELVLRDQSLVHEH